MYDVHGEDVHREAQARGSIINFAVWWDGDLLRELLDGNRITKWNWETQRSTRCSSPHGSARRTTAPSRRRALSADILGDWREEVIWRDARQQGAAHLHHDHPTPHRLVTLMHDPQYGWRSPGRTSRTTSRRIPASTWTNPPLLPKKPVIRFTRD